jgi:hypothetical protein
LFEFAHHNRFASHVMQVLFPAKQENDYRVSDRRVVNIAGMTPLPNRQGWSTSSEWVVNMDRNLQRL